MKICSGWILHASLALLLAGSAAAGLKTWQVGSGNWNDDANWAGGIPVEGDDVVINSGATVQLTAATPDLHSLTHSGKLTFSNWATALRAQTVTLASGSEITLPGAFTASTMSNRVWIACSNLIVASGASIDVSGKGYAGGPLGFDGYGPGKGAGSSQGRAGGAGYGGRGGWGFYASGTWGHQGGTAYGSAAAPEAPGSGGGTTGYAGSGGGAGGGAVRIEASGDVVIDGTIIANGANALKYSGGGSGGGVWISCNRFGGATGILTANGGALGVDSGGGGGGGRIAINYAELIGTPSVRFEVREAPGVLPNWNPYEREETRWFSRYGTLWFSDTQLLSTTLDHFYGTLVIPGFTSWAPASLTISNGLVALEPNFLLQVAGLLKVGTGGALELAPNGNLSAAGDVVVDGGRLVLNTFTQAVFQANLSLTNGGTFYAYSNPTNGTAAFGASVDVGGDIRIANASWILPDANYTNGGPVRFRCANIQIGAGGGFDATGRGFSGAFSVGRNGWGPGGGLRGTGNPKYGTGAGYGGKGGWGWFNASWGLSGGPTYGNTNAPIMPGSGGGNFSGYIGGHGGGTVWIEAADTFTLDGEIRADGGLPIAYSGGGSGGGIFLATRAFGGAASGSLIANGANSGGGVSPGGGGRIAVAIGLGDAAREALIANSPVPTLFAYPLDAAFAGTFSVSGGTGPDYSGEPWRAPQPGTYVFLTTNTTLNIVGTPNNFGHPAPDGYGACPYYAAGSWITNRVTTPDDEAGGTRHACIGWILNDVDGNPVDAGTTPEAVLKLDATRVLTWQWTNEYYLAIQEGVDGSVTTERSGWYTNTTVVVAISATADEGYIFDRWVGDFPAGGETANPLTVTMDQPRTLTPVFASASGLDKIWSGGVGGWEEAGNWAPPGMPGLYDRVSITSGVAIINLPRQSASVLVGDKGTLLFTNWVASLTVSNVTVAAGGLVTLPPAFTDDGMSNRVWIVCTNLTIAAGGLIDVTGKGYSGGRSGINGYGLGGGIGGTTAHAGGGGYGGRGAWCYPNLTERGGGVYATASEPVAPGSGGGARGDTQSYGGNGGGSIYIQASGDVRVDGTVRANGTQGNYYSGGGSGGGIWIACRRFAGDGVICANGGVRANAGGSGGGGRIALHYTSLMDAPQIRLEVKNGENAISPWHNDWLRFPRYWSAEPGTLYLSDTELLAAPSPNLFGRIEIPACSAWSPATLTLGNDVLLQFGSEFKLDVSGAVTIAAGGALELLQGSRFDCGGVLTLDGGRLVMSDFTQMTCRADFVLSNSGKFYAYSAPTNGITSFGATVNVAGDIRIGSSSWIYPDANITNGAPVRFCAQRVQIAPNGGFDADGRGFGGPIGSWRTAGYGPGAGALASYATGAGHGGRGGDTYYNGWGTAGGTVYGNRYAPILPGSGGGAHAQGRAGNGGGVIWLEATQAMNLDGILSANGLTTVWTASAGGSGGGIFISTPRLTGGATAVLRAEGGGGQLYSAPNGGGAGGGGRIAVALNMTPGKLERLLTGEPVSMEIVESLTAFAGSTSVAVGTTGPNYTGAEEHAPGEGTVFFMKGSERGTLILFR